MLFGALLIITWLILLLRYPAKALPVSLAAAAGLGVVAMVVIWQDSQETRRLEHLGLRMNYAPDQCPVGKPLLVLIDNTNDVPLRELRWRVCRVCAWRYRQPD